MLVGGHHQSKPTLRLGLGAPYPLLGAPATLFWVVGPFEHQQEIPINYAPDRWFLGMDFVGPFKLSWASSGDYSVYAKDSPKSRGDGSSGAMQHLAWTQLGFEGARATASCW